eukprot:GHVU01010339.1.p1 GENE.GHVU01010339.1~~GHVU01010339.1.p1  ORF type:complete len:127 (+),score=2.26 GHVU01010339.1:516-896(+)
MSGFAIQQHLSICLSDRMVSCLFVCLDASFLFSCRVSGQDPSSEPNTPPDGISELGLLPVCVCACVCMGPSVYGAYYSSTPFFKPLPVAVHLCFSEILVRAIGYWQSSAALSTVTHARGQHEDPYW